MFWWLRARENWYRDVWLFVLSAIVLVSVFQALAISGDARALSRTTGALSIRNAHLIAQVEAEISRRRNATCLLFEGQEVAAIRSVTNTYALLRQVRRKDRGSLLVVAIVRGLPAAYANAKASKPPAYCNLKGVGLPEPGPQLPKRRSFRYLLKG